MVQIQYQTNRLKELREARELSVRGLSMRTGIDYTTISTCERGQRNFSAKCIKTLSEFFGVSIDYLLGVSDEPTPAERAAPAPPIILNNSERELLNLFRRIVAIFGEKGEIAAKTALQGLLYLKE